MPLPRKTRLSIDNEPSSPSDFENLPSNSFFRSTSSLLMHEDAQLAPPDVFSHPDTALTPTLSDRTHISVSSMLQRPPFLPPSPLPTPSLSLFICTSAPVYDALCEHCR